MIISDITNINVRQYLISLASKYDSTIELCSDKMSYKEACYLAFLLNKSKIQYRVFKDFTVKSTQEIPKYWDNIHLYIRLDTEILSDIIFFTTTEKEFDFKTKDLISAFSQTNINNLLI